MTASSDQGDAASVTVIIATYRRPSFISELLEALAAQDHPHFDVIVVDDGSPPEDHDAVAAAVARHDWAELVWVPNGGPARARNRAAERAKSEWLAFTDDDCLPQPGWISGLVREALRSGATVVQGCTRSDPTADVADLGWFARAKDVVRWTRRFQMCNLMVRTSEYRDVGGLDERFPPSGFGEDTDLGLRLLERGHPTAFAPDAVVHHRWLSMTFPQFLRRRARWAEVVRVAALSPDGRSTFPHRYVAQRTHLAFWAGLPAIAVGVSRGWYGVPAIFLAGFVAYRLYKTRRQPWSWWIRALRAPLELVGLAVESTAFVVASFRFRTLLL